MSTEITRTLGKMSPVMRRALFRIADGDYAIHGREISSLKARGLIDHNLILTDLGEDVITHLGERAIAPGAGV